MSLLRILRYRSLLAVLAALALGAAGAASAFDAHDCPHHEHMAGRSDAGAEAAGAPDPAWTDGRESHRSGAAPEHPCTCIGACHAGATVPLPGSITVHTPIDARPRPDTVPTAAATPRCRFLPYLHPYPNPPPALG